MRMYKKKLICIVVCVLILVFNVLEMYTSWNYGYRQHDIISTKATVIEHYSYGGNDEAVGESLGTKLQDERGSIIVIDGWYGNIGEQLTVYQMPDSPNANGGDPKWYISPAAVVKSNRGSMIVFIICTLINLGVLIMLLKNNRKGKVEPEVYDAQG